MATITVEGGPSDWRALFEGRPGLAVTPENHDRLLAERALAEYQEASNELREPAPEPVAAPAPEPAPVPRTPPRRTPPPAPVVPEEA